DEEKRWALALTGGDDYELLFSAAPEQRDALSALAKTLDMPLTRIGRVQVGEGVNLSLGQGRSLHLDRPGYNHF
ncbi:MAG: thiamine-phosphate kinase, partial [Pseudomonadota bacterium]